MIETNSQPQNDPIPFAGRHLIYTRLQQHILDPIDHHAVVFSGHDGMGKTAMLRHAESLFRDPILAVYVPLSDTPNTNAVFQAIIAGINQLLEEYQFSLSRVPNINPESDVDLASWFDDIYLAEKAREQGIISVNKFTAGIRRLFGSFFFILPEISINTRTSPLPWGLAASSAACAADKQATKLINNTNEKRKKRAMRNLLLKMIRTTKAGY